MARRNSFSADAQSQSKPLKTKPKIVRRVAGQIAGPRVATPSDCRDVPSLITVSVYVTTFDRMQATHIPCRRGWRANIVCRASHWYIWPYGIDLAKRPSLLQVIAASIVVTQTGKTLRAARVLPPSSARQGRSRCE